MSDADNSMFEQMIKEAEEGDGLESMTGMEVKTSDEVRMVPDILHNGEEFYFPVFTTAEEMGEYIAQNPGKILDIMTLLASRVKKMTEDCNEAKKVLDDLRKANSSKNYDSFFANMMQQSIFLTSKNFRLERPSAESLREAAEAVSGQKPDDAVTYNYGTIIFKEGEVGKCMYIVHSGKVGVYKNYGAVDEVKLSEVVPVACFGELGMLTGDARNATAVAEVGDTEVEIIRPEDLEKVFKNTPKKIELILKNLSFRLRNITYDYFKACKEIYETRGNED